MTTYTYTLQAITVDDQQNATKVNYSLEASSDGNTADLQGQVDLLYSEEKFTAEYLTSLSQEELSEWVSSRVDFAMFEAYLADKLANK